MAGTLMTLAAGSTDEELSTLARSFSETPLGVGESCPVNMAAPAMPATTAMPAAPAAAPVKQEVAAAPTPQSAADALAAAAVDRQGVVKGKSVSVRVDLGGRRFRTTKRKSYKKTKR